MPLLDHFHPPLVEDYGWEGFHSHWASAMVSDLNLGRLPAGYRAEPRVRLGGGGAEVDIGALERNAPPAAGPQGNGVATAVWAPPQPGLETIASFADQDIFEVLLIHKSWRRLAAAIELVSPANKDRPDNRRAFVVKCASYLQAGTSVVLVDLVTDRRANLHADLMDLLGAPAADRWKSPTQLYATAYRILPRPEDTVIATRMQAWMEPMTLGAPLPTLPLWLAEDLVLPLELEKTYAATCASLLLP